MLQSETENPSATLLTLFMNAIPEVKHHQDRSPAAQKEYADGLKQVANFMKPSPSTMTGMSNPAFLRFTAAVCHFGDFDGKFETYAWSRSLSLRQITNVWLDTWTCMTSRDIKLEVRR